MRYAAFLIIWVVDFALKYAIGLMLVGLAWLPFGLAGDYRFGWGWLTAGLFIGACINGMFEGCDIVLMGFAKRLLADKENRSK